MRDPQDEPMIPVLSLKEQTEWLKHIKDIMDSTGKTKEEVMEGRDLDEYAFYISSFETNPIDRTYEE